MVGCAFCVLITYPRIQVWSTVFRFISLAEAEYTNQSFLQPSSQFWCNMKEFEKTITEVTLFSCRNKIIITRIHVTKALAGLQYLYFQTCEDAYRRTSPGGTVGHSSPKRFDSQVIELKIQVLFKHNINLNLVIPNDECRQLALVYPKVLLDSNFQ